MVNNRTLYILHNKLWKLFRYFSILNNETYALAFFFFFQTLNFFLMLKNTKKIKFDIFILIYIILNFNTGLADFFWGIYMKYSVFKRNFIKYPIFENNCKITIIIIAALLIYVFFLSIFLLFFFQFSVLIFYF